MRVSIIDVDTLSRNWWLVVLRGVLGIGFGIITFVAPAISLAALVLLFGAYAFADGVFALASAVRRRGTTDPWWVLLLEGLVGIGAGLITLFLPGITAIVLLYLCVVLYIGIFAYRSSGHRNEAEDYFLAGRSLGPFVFLFSLFGSHMTAFAILGSSGHAFTNGIVTYGLMASSSGIVMPVML